MLQFWTMVKCLALRANVDFTYSAKYPDESIRDQTNAEPPLLPVASYNALLPLLSLISDRFLYAAEKA